MLDWLAGFVARWTPVVAGPILDVVHWVGHAIASVVYTVFGAVGKAWLGVHDAWNWVDKGISYFVTWVYYRLDRIITKDIPDLWNWIVAQAKHVAQLVAHIYDLALAYALKLYRLAVNAIDDLARWVNVHVLEPLTDAVTQLRADLLKWGYTAWYYITHPDKLAPLLIGAMIAAAEDAFWDLAAPVGRFAFGIILKSADRFAALIETILSAVI